MTKKNLPTFGPTGEPYEPTPNGNVGVAASGAKRDQIGTKLETHLVPYALIGYAALGFNYGACKYGVPNYEKGLPLSVLLNSIDRHTRAMMNGETLDDDSQLPHLALLASSVAMLCENMVSGTIVLDINPREIEHQHPEVAQVSEFLCQMQHFSQSMRPGYWERNK